MIEDSVNHLFSPQDRMNGYVRELLSSKKVFLFIYERNHHRKYLMLQLKRVPKARVAGAAILFENGSAVRFWRKTHEGKADWDVDRAFHILQDGTVEELSLTEQFSVG
jgi:hypothetical protein